MQRVSHLERPMARTRLPEKPPPDGTGSHFSESLLQKMLGLIVGV